MDFNKNFRLNVTVRVLAMVLLVFIMVWGWLNHGWQVTPLVCALLVMVLVVDLIRYTERTTRQFATFLNFIRHHDFVSSVPVEQRGSRFSELADAYKALSTEYQRLNSEKTANYLLLESVIKHVRVALLCLNDRNELILMNECAKELFHVPYARSAKTLSKMEPELCRMIEQTGSGAKELINIRIGGELLQLAMYTTRFQLQDDECRLISFQNIRDELEQRESESWQKLIRVLTHEIKNSITPIVSLSAVISTSLLSRDNTGISLNTLSTQQINDLALSLNAIETRGRGLMDFVSTYSNLADIPTPCVREINTGVLLERVRALMEADLERAGVELDIHNNAADTVIQADMQQIEQVLINLIKNARDALEEQEDKKILVATSLTPSLKVQIIVRDNGPGILPDNLNTIFVPFFTTRKKGNGIGLSISRQLMFANKGALSVKSEPGAGAEFVLSFNQAPFL